jgi:hypothetical protein
MLAALFRRAEVLILWSRAGCSGATIYHQARRVQVGAVALRGGAALTRSRVLSGKSADSPSISPWTHQEDGTDADVLSRCPELDCLRGTLAPGLLADAKDRANALGVSADRVLIASGAVSEEVYLRTLGKYLRVSFEPLDEISRALCPINDERLIESAAAGLLPLMPDGNLSLVVAPRGIAARRISEMIADNPRLARRFRFTTTERLSRFVLRCAGRTLAARASGELKRAWPTLSAAPPRWPGHLMPIVFAGPISLAAFLLAPTATVHATEILLATIFLAWLGLRLLAAFIGSGLREHGGDTGDTKEEALPVYTVIAALYREAACVDGLLLAIERLDYPALGSKCT